jgi:hypothetical protein
MPTQVFPVSVERLTYVPPPFPLDSMIALLEGQNSISSVVLVSTLFHTAPPLTERHKPLVAAQNTKLELPWKTLTCLLLLGPVPVVTQVTPALVDFRTPPDDKEA